MPKTLAAGTVPWELFACGIGLAIVFVFLLAFFIDTCLVLNDCSDALDEEKKKSKKLQKEVEFLKGRLCEKDRTELLMKLREGKTLPENWQETQKLLNSQENYSKGVKKKC